MTTILLAGVPNSPNLGDGLIAATLNQIIRMKGEIEIIHFDLVEGRCRQESLFSPVPARRPPGVYRLNRDDLKKRLTPDWMRMAKSYWLHCKQDSDMKAQIRSAIAESDAVFIGGGHLLIDTYLTFPLSVRRVAAEAQRQGKPVHLMMVGARGPWSLPARAWFLDVCRTSKTISVRDNDSKAFLVSIDRRLEAKIVVLADPALCTTETFPLAAVQRGQAARPVIGLGIMDPHEMNRHADFRWDRQTCAHWWRDLAAALMERGFAVDLFTNGSATDNAFMEQYIKPCIGRTAYVRYRDYPTTVPALVRQIADCDAVIAQRLHACIPAISMQRPTYGLIWDRKLQSIFNDLGLEANVVDYRTPAAEVAKRVDLTGAMSARFLELLKQKQKQLHDYVGGIVV